jgi:hypothetical protein
MSRRNAIITVAVVALCMATVSIAEAAGRRRSGTKGRPNTPATTTRTVVNSTNEALFTYVLSGTAGMAQTVGAANAQGAKTINPNGGQATFNVKPNGGGNQFGDTVFVYQASTITGDPNQSLIGSGEGNDVGVLQAGQKSTTTITGSWGALNFNTIP